MVAASQNSEVFQTPYGVVDECDVVALEQKLWWYLRYGALPSATRRESAAAKEDYGFQYERYVGYLFEAHGYKVIYNGLKRGVQDGGIDLVAKMPRKIRLIQCKRWRQPVDADVVSRLQGAIQRFTWEECRGKDGAVSRTDIRGVLATSGDATPEALALARHLRIFTMTHLEYQPYPAVKARPFPLRGGRFYLPFDRAYDSLVMNLNGHDRFFFSIREALLNGFYYLPYHREILRKLHEEP